MKCPRCGTEMEWMGDVKIIIIDVDKYYCNLSKKAFRSKDIELWGVDWAEGIYSVLTIYSAETILY